jgi:hypothetical protein
MLDDESFTDKIFKEKINETIDFGIIFSQLISELVFAMRLIQK